jgi:hypothetical protein
MNSEGGRPRISAWQFRFSLASILLAMAVISMCLALARVHLESGLLVSFLTVPALIRTALVATRESRNDKPISALEKVLEFLFSWMLMLPIGLAALIVGGVAFTFVSFLGFLVMGTFDYPFGSGPPQPMEYAIIVFFFVLSIAAGLGAGGLFLAWGIRGSLAYRPVTRI